MNEKRLIKSKREDLTQWYTDVVTKAQLIHYSPIKGIMTFLPNAWAIWEQIQAYLNQRFKELGIRNLALPSLIPESIFEKEREHVTGFNPELFKVQAIGEKKLTEPYILRPTSEVMVSQVFHDLINNVKQLPVLFNQWANVFRSEKNPRPFLRNCEFFWQEVHGALANFTDAQRLAQQVLQVYIDLLSKYLLIPSLRGEKTPNERFAGAKISYTLESIMPDGQVLQCATSHVLGDTFSRAYDIKYQNSENKFSFVEMMSAGISTRILGGMIMQHGDDFGLVIPFQIAPVQIMINSMNYDRDAKVKKIVDEVYRQLTKKFRVGLDQSPKTISQKIIQSELTGIPMQIIVGPKEATNNSLIVYDRLKRDKHTLSLLNYAEYLNKLIDYWENTYFALKDAEHQQLVRKVTNYAELIQTLAEQKIALAPWGGDEKDEVQLKQKCGATGRCVAERIDEKQKISCFFSTKPAKYWVYFARAY